MLKEQSLLRREEKGKVAYRKGGTVEDNEEMIYSVNIVHVLHIRGNIVFGSYSLLQQMRIIHELPLPLVDYLRYLQYGGYRYEHFIRFNLELSLNLLVYY